jgi:uncharacterized membrane protein
MTRGRRSRTSPTTPGPAGRASWVIPVSFALSFVAVGLTTYLTVTHYTDPTALACPDTGIVNCTLVTTSSWSVIFGVPVAVLGLAWALGMAGLNSPWAWRSHIRWLSPLRLAGAAAGAAMVLYLVYTELFRVGAICLWCTGVHITAVALFAVVLVARTSRVTSGLVGDAHHVGDAQAPQAARKRGVAKVEDAAVGRR